MRALRQDPPAADFRLDAAARAKVPPGIDADALERLLAHIIPEERADILAYFQVPLERGRGYLMGFHDPQLQPLLEEVWAPMWDFSNATDEQIRNRDYPFPGAAIALARRAAAKTREPGETE